jgi:hypothetical protein
MTLPDLRALLGALVAAEVEFVTIGGVAVGLHGFIRATEDLDVVPDPAHDNLERLGAMLMGLSATLTLRPARRFGARELWELRRGRNISVSTSIGDLDIVRSLPGVPAYEELAANAARFDVGGIEVRVASADHLIAMKQARATDLDRADIAALRELSST